MKSTALLIVILFIVGGIAYLLNNQQSLPGNMQKAPNNTAPSMKSASEDQMTPQGPVTLSFTPATISAQAGQEVNLTVTMDTKGVTATASELHFDYDPTVLELVSLTPGAFLPVTIEKAKLESGKASIAVGAKVESPQKGSGEVAVLKFKALKTSSAPVKVNISSSTLVAALESNSNSVGDLMPAMVTVNP